MSMTSNISLQVRLTAVPAMLFLLLAGCTGTEVGNGLKPKPDDSDDKTATQQANHKPKPTGPSEGSVSDSQSPVVAPLEVPVLRNLMLQSCGTPLNNAKQADLVLSRINDPMVAAEKIFDATVAAGVWTLNDGSTEFTVTPSGLWDFKGETRIKLGGPVVDMFTCSTVTRTPLTEVEGSTRFKGVYSTTMSRVTDGNLYKLEWTATVDVEGAPLQAEYRLEQVTISGPEGRSTVFAIYPAQ